MSNALAFLFGAGLIVGILALAVMVLLIISGWRIFSKAGKHGWAIFIPIYNIYVFSDVIVGNSSYFFAVLGASIISYLLSYMHMGFLSILVGLFSICLSIFASVKLAASYGKGTGYTLGLIFLPVIFIPMLGLGSSAYIGPQ